MAFKHRIRLPYLRTFVFDLAQDDWAGDRRFYFYFDKDSKRFRGSPAVTTFLNSVLFFIVEWEEEWRMELVFNYARR